MRILNCALAAACLTFVPAASADDDIDDVYVLQSHAGQLYSNFYTSEYGPYYPAEYPTMTLGYGGGAYWAPGPNYHPTNGLSYYVPAAPGYYATPAARLYPIEPSGFYAPSVPYSTGYAPSYSVIVGW